MNGELLSGNRMQSGALKEGEQQNHGHPMMNAASEYAVRKKKKHGASGGWACGARRQILDIGPASGQTIRKKPRSARRREDASARFWENPVCFVKSMSELTWQMMKGRKPIKNAASAKPTQPPRRDAAAQPNVTSKSPPAMVRTHGDAPRYGLIRPKTAENKST